MNVTGYTEALARTLLETASLGDERTQEVARGLVAALDPALRLTWLQMLSDAAAQLGDEVDGVRVTVVMDGGTPHLMVTELVHPAAGTVPAATSVAPLPGSGRGSAPSAAGGGVGEPDAGGTGPGAAPNQGEVRTTLRMPASLKAQVDEAAQAQGRSVNAWLLDAVRAGLPPAVAHDAWDDEPWDTGPWTTGPWGSGTGPGPGGPSSTAPAARGMGAGLHGWYG